MRGRVNILISLLLSGEVLYAQPKILTAYHGYASYSTPSGQTYVENYLTIIGNTIKLERNKNNKYQGKVQVQVTYSQGDSVKKSSIYNVLSPEVEDTLKAIDFIDVQRYWLSKGLYNFQLKIEDLNDSAHKVVTLKGKIYIGYSSDTLCVADAEFLQSYSAAKVGDLLSKSGYDMEPYVYDFYPVSVTKLSFYSEIYNLAKVIGQQKIVLKYYIESSDNHTPLYEFNNVSVQMADTVNPVLGSFNIEKLPSGNYNLVISALDKTNKILVSRRYNFIRNNPNIELSAKDLAVVRVDGSFVDKMNNKDSLADDIKSLWPIAGLRERGFIEANGMANSNILLLKQYFYNFWISRDPANPQEAWLKYYKQVLAVNKSFKTFSVKGYATDRGRVYLQYGAPNLRTRSDLNPASYPYEIWEYYKLQDGQVDVKFVFYEPTLSTNNYELLHSTAKGEIHNRQWQIILYGTSGRPTDIDQNKVTDPMGEDILNNYSTPH
jgi:GWxTD domain-containing protein